jgi:hypothetical protein
MQTTKVLLQFAYPDKGFVTATIFDKRLNEEFEVTLYYVSEHSLAKLEKMINCGVDDEEAKFLRLIGMIRDRKTQAKCFSEFARNEIPLEKLEAIVRSSTGRKVDRLEIVKYRNKVLEMFRDVCSLPDFTIRRIVYWEDSSYRFFLVLDSYNWPRYAVVVDGHNVAVLNPPSIYFNYAVFKYVLERDEGLLKKWLNKASRERPDYLLRDLNKAERGNSIQVQDHGLYDYLKTLLAMSLIA